MEANNPDLESLVLTLAGENEIWLVHKDAGGIGTNHQGHIEPL